MIFRIILIAILFLSMSCEESVGRDNSKQVYGKPTFDLGIKEKVFLSSDKYVSYVCKKNTRGNVCACCFAVFENNQGKCRRKENPSINFIDCHTAKFYGFEIFDEEW